MNLAEAKRRLTIPILWETLDLPGEPAESCRSPLREDRRPSFSIYAQGTRWHDHATGEDGDAVDFLRRATGLSKSAACRKFLKLAAGLPVLVDAALLEATSGGATSNCPGGNRGLKKSPRKPGTRPDLPKIHDPASMKRPAVHDEWLDRLAELRQVSRAAVDLAHQRGLLHFCDVKVPGSWFTENFSFEPLWIDKPTEALAWVVTDGHRVNAQMRFLDGSTWDHLLKPPKMGEGPKAKTWQGSWASWPTGAPQSEQFPTVMLVEGGPDLLAACHSIAAAGRQDSVGVVAMMGAGLSIPQEALSLFTDKRVRIYPHIDTDEKGQKAAVRWGDQLRAAGADVDAFDLSDLRKADGTAIKDLNDCCLIHPDDAAELGGLLP